jgi:nucleoside-diphosphate-sugar epimerase
LRSPSATDLDSIIDRTESCWSELRGQRLFITGGTGFIGRWLVESFLWANERLNLRASICILTRDAQAFLRQAPQLESNAAISFLQSDIASFSFPDGSFSHVIHAAGDAVGWRRPGEEEVAQQTLIEGTRRTLEFAANAKAQKFLLLSSGAVYGRFAAGLTRMAEERLESGQCEPPASVYGKSKLVAERLVSSLAPPGLEVKIARGFSFIGPYLPLDGEFAAGNFIRDGLRGGPIRIKGDGTPVRSFLYAADMAAWLWIILSRGRSSRPYNVGSDSAVTIAELARLVSETFPHRPQVEIGKNLLPESSWECYVPDVNRTVSELDVVETTGLREGIKKTVSFLSDESL